MHAQPNTPLPIPVRRQPRCRAIRLRTIGVRPRAILTWYSSCGQMHVLRKRGRGGERSRPETGYRPGHIPSRLISLQAGRWLPVLTEASFDR